MEEASIWFDMWGQSCTKGVSFTQVVHRNVSLIDLLDQSILFPAVNAVIMPYRQQPALSSGRSFSTLRRVKTWLRSTMTDERLSGLCMMSVHRSAISNDKTFVDRVVDKFLQNPRQNPRRLQFLFRNQQLD